MQTTCVWWWKAALSTAIALQTDFPFQTVYKDMFKPLVPTQCTNITWNLAELQFDLVFVCVLILNNIVYIFFKYNIFGTLACLDNKVDYLD